MSELVVAGERQLQRDAECLDSHDRDRANSRANAEIDERVLFAVLRSDLVDHNAGEDADHKGVEQEPWKRR